MGPKCTFSLATKEPGRSYDPSGPKGAEADSERPRRGHPGRRHRSLTAAMGNPRRSPRELRGFCPALQACPRGREVAVCWLAKRPCNASTTFSVDSRPDRPRGYVTRRVDSIRQEAEGTAARAGASTFPRIPASAWPPTLTATQDGRHGRLPASRPRWLLPLPPGRQAVSGHLPAWGMAGPAPGPANGCRPGPLPPC